MAKGKQYRVIAPVGVVGFKGVIHKHGDVIDGNKVPEANLKVWLRFGQVEAVAEQKAEGKGSATADKLRAETEKGKNK